MENKSKKGLLITLIVILLLIVGGLAFYKFLYKKDEPIKKPEETPITNSDLSGIDLLYEDYESKKISTSDYFNQLVYIRYNKDKVDTKYKSEEDVFYDSYDPVYEFIIDNKEEVKEKVSQEDIEKYLDLKYKYVRTIDFADPEAISNQNSTTDEYKVKKMQNTVEDDQNNLMNRVYLTSKGRFLVWYNYNTDFETIKQSGEELEKTVEKYEKIFKIEFKFKEYTSDRVRSKDNYEIAKTILKYNKIPEEYLDTAMGVFFAYDTTALAYYSEPDLRYDFGDLLVNPNDYIGKIQYPFIVVCRQTMRDNTDNVLQVVNHELFHHFQYIYCIQKSTASCKGGTKITEAMANYASSLVSDVKYNSTNFLNDWSGKYVYGTSVRLEEFAPGKLKGYALFWFFDAYVQNNENALDTIMTAHTKYDSYKYIKENTEKEKMLETYYYLSNKVLNKDHDNNNYWTDKNVKYRDGTSIIYPNVYLGNNLEYDKEYDIKHYAGAIDYYKIEKGINIELDFPSFEYTTAVVYGLKDGKYIELQRANNKTGFKLTFYNDYESFVLAMINANLVDDSNYKIKLVKGEIKETPVEEPIEEPKEEEVVTIDNIKNYNIEIDIETTISSLTVSQHSTGVVDEEHQLEYLKAESITAGISVPTEVYYDFKNGVSYSSQPFSSEWIKQKEISQTMSLNDLNKRLKSMKNVTKVSSDHYRVGMSKSDIEAWMKTSGSNSYAIKGNVSIEVYLSNGFISKLEYDLSNSIDGITSYKATVKYSNYNKAGSVEIPSSVIKNAK